MIVGLSGAVIQGAAVTTQAIDIWVDDLGSENFKSALTEVGGFYIRPSLHAQTPPMLGPSKYSLIELVVSMSGLGSFEEELKNSTEIIIDKIPIRVLNLKRIIASKTAANRDKDRAVLPILLATQKTISEKNRS
jgi:hypothetical protein